MLFIKIIYILVYVAIYTDKSNTLSHGLVKRWAKLMGEKIEDIMENGLKYMEIQKLYDDARYERLYVDWSKKLQEIHSKLGMSFVRQRAALDFLAQKTALYYEDWESSGRPRTVTDLNELSSSIYLNSDKLHTYLNRTNIKFNTNSLYNRSSVKLPTLASKTNRKIIDTVMWSSNLERIFKENFKKDQSIRYQFFGSATGMFRSFPIRPWETDTAGRSIDFDPRVRPWYVAAITLPKNAIIIYDASATMAKSQARALAVTHAILNTLTSRDYLSVIISKSSYYDVSGTEFVREPYVLGCSNQTSLLPANPSYSYKLFYLLQKVKLDGGSDHTAAFKMAFDMLAENKHRLCHNVILFITDGITLDGSQRCNPGQYYYDYNGAKRFVAGNICIFNERIFASNVKKFQSRLVKQNLPKAYIFSFTVSHDSHSYLNNFACDNNGINIALHDKRVRTTKALAPYYKFLTELKTDKKGEQVWISPYLDALNSDLIVTASKAVYGLKNGNLIGVVGIDITLDAIEEALSKETWNSVTYFVIDRYGHAILHPLIKHSEELTGDPIFIHITLLEQFDGKPSKFDNVLKRMLARENGSEVINKDAYVAFYNGEYEEGLSWKPVYRIDYSFGSLQGSDYSFAFKIPYADNLFNIPITPYYGNWQGNTFLADVEGYTKLVRDPPKGFGRQIDNFVQSFVGSKNDVEVSYNYSAVHLSPKAFCSSEEYMFDYKPSLEALHLILNTPQRPEPCTSERGIIKSHIWSDIAITGKMEKVWEVREQENQKDITVTVISTLNDVSRVYPALQVNRQFEPHKQAYFNKALLNVGKNVLIPTFKPYFKLNSARILTMARSIMLGKPRCNRDFNNAGSPLVVSDSYLASVNDGCPCKVNADCNSNYCYQDTCSNSIAHAVAAMNYGFEAMKNKLYQSILKLSPDRHCGSVYPCPYKLTENCTIRCIIMENSTQIVIHPNFSSQAFPEGEEDSFENVYLEKNEPGVFVSLFKLGVIYYYLSTDFQAVCVEDPSGPMHFEFSNLQSDVQQSSKEKRKYNCIKEITLYAMNHSYLDSLPSGVFAHTVNTSVCSLKLYVSHIPTTNLYLIVQEDQPLSHSCFLNLNANMSHLKKEFSLCRDYSYAKTYVSNDTYTFGTTTQEELLTCPADYIEFDPNYCSTARPTKNISYLPYTVFIYLLLYPLLVTMFSSLEDLLNTSILITL